LFDLSAKVDESNLSGQTALIWAVERQHNSVVKILLKKRADPNITQNGLSALHKAVRSGYLETVKLLIEEGQANLHMESSKETDCCSVLQDAAFYGRADIVQYLLEHEADVEQRNAQGRTALHRAVYKNHVSIVQLLLDCGADINSQDNNQRTCTHWAAFFGHEVTWKALLDAGADLSLTDRAGHTPIIIARNRKHLHLLDSSQQ